MSFTTYQIKANTVGDFLRRVRQSSGFSLKEIEKRIGVPVKYLEVIESNDFWKLPGSVYTRGFLERYAKFLNLNTQEIIKRWQSESGGARPLKKKENNRKNTIFSLNLNLKVILIYLVAIFIVFYFGYSLKKILFQPKIEILFPPQNFITNELSLVIEGQTESGANVFINHEPVSEVDNGYFNQKIDLSSGVNIIEISAKKKYSRERVIERRVVVEE